MSLENHAGLMDKKRVVFAYQQPHQVISDLIGQKISQKESQMKHPILKILTILDEYGPINNSQIQKCAKVKAPKSMRILCEKNIIRMKQRPNKKNNEKIYYLNRIRAIIYLDQLFNQEKLRTKLEMIENEFGYLDRLIDRFDFKIWNLWVFFSQKMKKMLNLTRDDYLLRGLPRRILIPLLKNYQEGYFCKECTKSGKKIPGIRKRNFLYVTEITVKNESYYCEYGHEIEIKDIPPRIRRKEPTELGTIDSKKRYSDIMKRTGKKANSKVKLI